MAELSRDDVLPCDVLVAPGTIIRAGCNVSTLLLCLGNRVGREIAKLGPRGEVRAPQAVSVPEVVSMPMPNTGTYFPRCDHCGCLVTDHRPPQYSCPVTAAPAAATREGKE